MAAANLRSTAVFSNLLPGLSLTQILPGRRRWVKAKAVEETSDVTVKISKGVRQENEHLSGHRDHTLVNLVQ